MSVAGPIRFLTRFIFPAVLTLAALSMTAGAATTLENLQTAFKGEKNAHTRYLAFAQRADTEGYGEVASLFRAAAKAEEIHAANDAAVIKEMGGNAPTELETLTVRTTRENLEFAIKGEVNEIDTVYPEFLEQAKSERNLRALIALNFARSAELEHAKLLRAALANLERLKGSRSTVYYVCPTCGFVTQQMNFAKCPHCFTPESASEIVS